MTDALTLFDIKAGGHIGHDHAKRLELRHFVEHPGCVNADIWCHVCDMKVGTHSRRTGDP